jgi:hypothetical protein
LKERKKESLKKMGDFEETEVETDMLEKGAEKQK